MRIAAALLEHQGSYAFMLRNQPPFERFLGLIGGKVEAGETSEQAIVREIREETGCTAVCESVGSLTLALGGATYEHALFMARTGDMPKTTEPESGEIIVLPQGALAHAKLHVLHRLVVELIRDGTPFTAHARVGPDYALESFSVER